MSKVKRLPVVFLPCSGIGHVNRGYEAFTTQCFDHLKNSKDFRLIMFKAAGPETPNSITIPCIKRTHPIARFVGKYLKYRPYFVEQITFFFGMIPSVFKYKPDLIFYSDSPVGTQLYYLRKLFRLKYKLLFSNGAPKPPPYKVEDHIQHLLPLYIEKAVKEGVPRSKQSALAGGINFAEQPHFLDSEDKAELRRKLNIPPHKKVVISVGAVSSAHKRMDYVVKAFSHLDQEKYYLVILGNIDNSSGEIFDLAKSILLSDNYQIKQVPSGQVGDYLLSADYFILASFNEGLPRVLAEALQFGLIPIVHDYDVARESLEQYGVFGNLANETALQSLINEVDRLNLSKEDLWQFAYDKYSWQCLKGKYARLFLDVIKEGN